MRRGGKRRAAHSRNSILMRHRKEPCRKQNRKRAAWIPRDAPSYFASTLKISGSHQATLRWMRSAPGSFRDFPAPRIGAARRDASPYHWVRGSGLPNVTCKVQAPLQDAPFYILHFTFYILPARWWTQDAAHRCQRSICFPPTATTHQQKTAELYQMPPLDATDGTIDNNAQSKGCYVALRVPVAGLSLTVTHKSGE